MTRPYRARTLLSSFLDPPCWGGSQEWLRWSIQAEGRMEDRAVYDPIRPATIGRAGGWAIGGDERTRP